MSVTDTNGNVLQGGYRAAGPAFFYDFNDGAVSNSGGTPPSAGFFLRITEQEGLIELGYSTVDDSGAVPLPANWIYLWHVPVNELDTYATGGVFDIEQIQIALTASFVEGGEATFFSSFNCVDAGGLSNSDS
jgi:hypothetical protein